MPLTTLFLDAGGVLVTPNWTRVSATLGAHGVTVAADALLHADPLARHDLDVGLGHAASDQQRGWTYFNLVLERCGVKPSPGSDRALDELQQYHSVHNLWERVPDGVPAALDRLRGMGFRLVVVSNANGKVRELFDRLDLARRFDVILDSAVEGVEKPDPRLFEIGLERSGASRDETVHVGDLYNVDVVGARRAGLRAVLVDEAGLYERADCPRIQSLAGLPEIVGRI